MEGVTLRYPGCRGRAALIGQVPGCSCLSPSLMFTLFKDPNLDKFSQTNVDLYWCLYVYVSVFDARMPITHWKTSSAVEG